MSPEGVDAQGRPIWGGYVQDQTGNWVLPDTGGGGASAAQNVGPEGLDALGRPIWGGYVQGPDGAWIKPQMGSDVPSGRPTLAERGSNYGGGASDVFSGRPTLEERGSNYGGGASDVFSGRPTLAERGANYGGGANDAFSSGPPQTLAAPTPWLGGMNALSQAIAANGPGGMPQPVAPVPTSRARFGWP